jgi:hypothetical protein
MHIEVRLPRQINLELPLRDYDPALDDIRSILADICLAIGPEGDFVVSGFGQSKWPVDVATDLLVLLEQLPSLVRSISSGLPARLDFYEQGIERALVFTPIEDDYDLLCESRSEWQPNPRTERVSRADLLRMLLAVRDGFLELVRRSAPELEHHPWVVAWLGAE